MNEIFLWLSMGSGCTGSDYEILMREKSQKNLGSAGILTHGLPAFSRRSAALPYKKPLSLTCNPDKENDDSIPSNLLLNDIPTSQSVISRFFPDCSSDIRPPRSYDKTCAKVLTGAEFRKEQEEKERLKKQKEQEANERGKQRKQLHAKASKSKARKGKYLLSWFIKLWYQLFCLI